MLAELDHHARTILRFIERYQTKHGFSPTYEEIRVGAEMSSKDHVSRDLKRLAQLAYIQIKRKASRGIVLLQTADGYPVIPGGYRIPVRGYITAGQPIPLPDANSAPIEWIDVMRTMIPDPEGIFALRVRGDSMIDALVNDGDTVILRATHLATNGDFVAARLRNDPTNLETTLKVFYRDGNQIKLQPRNPKLYPRWYDPNDVEIQGKVFCVISFINGNSVKPN
jgi:repressor LexA